MYFPELARSRNIPDHIDVSTPRGKPDRWKVSMGIPMSMEISIPSGNSDGNRGLAIPGWL